MNHHDASSPESLLPVLIHHLPVIQILLPMMGAPIIVLLGRRLAWLMSTLLASGAFAVAIALMSLASGGEPLRYELGGWTAPVGIVYVVDYFSSFMLTIVSAVGAMVMVYARTSVKDEIPEERHHYFYAMLLLCMAGLMGICITGDAFNVFVFLEISSLSAYALIAMGRSPRALVASYRYLVMGTVGGTFVLLGIGMLYMMTGTLNIADLAVRVPTVADKTTIRAAFAFMTVGSLVKLALFPLHFWLPNAYTFAPSVVSAFLSATATKVSFYVLVRVIFTVFGAALMAQTMQMHNLLLLLSLIAIVMGSLVAIFQNNVKRLLAYSSLAQIGYFVLGLALHNETALTGSLIHLFNHALMKGGLFMVVGCMVYRIGGCCLDDLAGIGRSMPLTFLAFAIGGVGMIGVPLTAGFVSKWYLVLGALEAGLWWVALIVLFASLLAVMYVWRVIEVGWFRDPPDDAPQEAPLSLLVPAWVMIGASVVFGIWTGPMLHIASKAAQMLFGGIQ